ncbi:MAG: hypothetical protein AB1453_01665 [Chloroflexota bacterium]
MIISHGCARTPSAAPLPDIPPPVTSSSSPLPSAIPTAATATAAQETPAVAVTPSPTTAPPTPAPPTPTLGADDWKTMPVIPQTISARTIEIFQQGLAMGNNPNAFSKVGDSNSTLPGYLGEFDRPRACRLGEYAYLQGVIDHFSGSWGRRSLGVKVGMSTNGILSPLWADWRECKASETPLSCELRIHKPSFILIALGTNDAYYVHEEPVEERLRKVIELCIANGTVPILTTKVDNLEGDHLVNQIITRLALEYDIPLHNLWAAMRELPDNGLVTAFHYTAGEISPCEFSNPDNLRYGWTIRNLTSAQVLDAVWRGVNARPAVLPKTE